MERYESEVTLFLRDFLRKHPEEVAKQKAARATWWDRPYDAEARAAAAESKVPKKAYEYYSNNR